MSSQELRKNIGESALLRAKNYQTENVVKQWYNLIQKLIK
jgi:glycosyltransferase involved in cell wall biosynthesis